jgi:hypothetical protein
MLPAKAVPAISADTAAAESRYFMSFSFVFPDAEGCAGSESHKPLFRIGLQEATARVGSWFQENVIQIGGKLLSSV